MLPTEKSPEVIERRRLLIEQLGFDTVDEHEHAYYAAIDTHVDFSAIAEEYFLEHTIRMAHVAGAALGSKIAVDTFRAKMFL